MPRSEETRNGVFKLIEQGENSIPDQLLEDLPPGKYTSGQAEWHEFEHQIFKAGEEIRQILASAPSLRKDESIQIALLQIATNRHAKRGRQSFVMLLGYQCCQNHALELSSQIGDPAIAGHVIDTLLKMKAGGFSKKIEPFTNHSVAWIRQAAMKYCERFRS